MRRCRLCSAVLNSRNPLRFCFPCQKSPEYKAYVTEKHKTYGWKLKVLADRSEAK